MLPASVSSPNPLSEITTDNRMRLYDKDFVAAQPNLAFMPFGAGPHLFRCGDGLSAGCNSCSPSFADPCPESEAVFARDTPEHRNFIVLESPVPAR